MSNDIAIVERVKPQKMLQYHASDPFVVGAFVESLIHFTRRRSRTTLRFHPRGHRRHPSRRARNPSPGGIRMRRALIILFLPIDVSEVLIKSPRRRIRSRPCV